jgi:hypothetical protein
MSNVKHVCPHCGSDEIVADASAAWNGKQWELDLVFETGFCLACEHDIDIYPFVGADDEAE